MGIERFLWPVTPAESFRPCARSITALIAAHGCRHLSRMPAAGQAGGGSFLAISGQFLVTAVTGGHVRSSISPGRRFILDSGAGPQHAAAWSSLADRQHRCRQILGDQLL
jgi:hypothetical protein